VTRIEATAGPCGPLETTRATALPLLTTLPAAGFWLMTRPAATVSLAARVTVPTLSEAALIALCAAACSWPTTSGTLTGTGAATTISRKLCGANRPPWSWTRTVTGWLPIWPALGVHWIRPLAALMLMPAGAVVSEKVSVSPGSGSLAVTG
jgi:hypothetical protein